MHAAYVIGTSARYSRYLLQKKLKTLVPRALLSYMSSYELLRTLEKCEKHSPSARACPHFSRVLKNSQVLIELNNALARSLYRFISLIMHMPSLLPSVDAVFDQSGCS